MLEAYGKRGVTGSPRLTTGDLPMPLEQRRSGR
jgi:hypothetical protein